MATTGTSPPPTTHPENVHVYLRFRPPSPSELGSEPGALGAAAGAAASNVSCARVNDGGGTVTLADGGVQHRFDFDGVFDEDAGQGDVYDATSSSLVEELISGRNCAVVVYGNTGSGKTHTLMPPSSSSSAAAAAARSAPLAARAEAALDATSGDRAGDDDDRRSLDGGDVSSLGSSGASEAIPTGVGGAAGPHAQRHQPPARMRKGTTPPPSQVFMTMQVAGLQSSAASQHSCDPLGTCLGDDIDDDDDEPPLLGPTPMQRMISKSAAAVAAAAGEANGDADQNPRRRARRGGPTTGGENARHREENRGILQRFVRDLFDRTPRAALRRDRDHGSSDEDDYDDDEEEDDEEGDNDDDENDDEFVRIACSFVEVTADDEELRDLLLSEEDAAGDDDANDGAQSGGDNAVTIAEDGTTGGVVVQGAVRCRCYGESDVLRLLERGNEVRRGNDKKGGAAENDDGHSRSHAIFTIDYERHLLATSSMVKSRMLLVELGGDMMSRSLSTLGNVIYALTEDSQSRVPYDDSVLSSILRDAFGGNSKTALILTASPSSCCVQETVFTIRFGQRARHVVNRVRTNRMRSDRSFEPRKRRRRRPRKNRPAALKKEASASAGNKSALVPVDSPPPTELTMDTAQTDASSVNSRDAYEKLMRAKAMLEAKSQSGSNKSLGVESVQGAARQMEADLSSARRELSTVSNLLRSAAERMEADLSAAKRELAQSSPTAQEFAGRDGGFMEAELLAAKAALGELPMGEDGQGPEPPLHLTAQQISLDLEAARRELLGEAPNGDEKKQPMSTDLDTKLNGTGQVGAVSSEEAEGSANEVPIADLKSLEKTTRLKDVEREADAALRKQRKKEEAMEKEIAALRRENETLSRVKKKRDEELVRAKKEIKVLTLRATEAEKTIRKAEYRDPAKNDGTNRAMPMLTAEDAQARAREENLGVSNIVSSQFQSGSSNDADSASHPTDDFLIDKENIRVCLRLRPMSKLETSRRSRVCFDVHEDSKSFTVESLSGEYDFTYDQVFGSDASNSDVYAFAGTPVVSALLSGINCCVMVYGLSSSGKTHTLTGRLPDALEHDEDDCGEAKDATKAQDPSQADCHEKDPEAGIAPRLIKDLFKGILEGPESSEFTIKCSYVGIYLEKMFDLLQAQETKNLVVQDDPKGIQVVNACEVCCFDEGDVFALLQRGQACLSVLAQRMNVDVNRSHSVFIIKVEQRNIYTGAIRTAQLHLADLAGFEMPVKTKGQTMQELKIVHKSFSALGNVIKALMENSIHAPYRESKLTCLLKDALGGNCKTTLIVTASPSSYSISETTNTIRIGQRLRRVVNMPRVNHEVSIEDYKKWLMTTEVKLGELVTFVKELACQLHREGNLENGDKSSTPSKQILSNELWGPVNAIVEEEENVNNPCREALSLGDLEEIQKCGAKWKALSSEIVTRIRSDEMVEIAQARAKAESLLSDIQSEVVVLRRQNDLLVQDKRRKGEEVSKLKKEVKLLSLRIAELEHNLSLSQHREKEAGVFLRHLRKICWNLQKDIHTERATEISDITASMTGAPDLTGLVDLDTLLLEAGLIGTRDIDEEDFDLEDGDENNFLDWSQTKLSKRNSESGNDLSGLGSTEDGREDHANANAGLSIMKGVSTFLRKGGDPIERSDADDSSATQPTHVSSRKQRKLQRDLRNMTNKCIELQMLLNEERERMNSLTNRSRSLNVKNLSQEVIALGKERDRMYHYAKAATWKLQELHVVNKVLTNKGKETTEHVASLEEGFQRLQETFRTTVLDSLEADKQLNEKITSLEAVVDSLTVPQHQNMDVDDLARTIPRMNLPLRGRCVQRKDGGGPRDPNSPATPGARCLMLANSSKLPEQMPSSCVRRTAKYRRRIKKTGDAGASGVGKEALATKMQRCRRALPPTFTGNLVLLESMLDIEEYQLES